MSLAGDLTDLHFRRQTAISTSTEQVVARIFRDLFDPKDVNGSWAKIEPLLTALVQARHQVSAGVAANYLTAFRSALLVPGRYVPTVEGLLVADDVVPWLKAAPAEAWARIDAGEADILGATLRKAQGSVTRMVLDGGRATVLSNVEADGGCIGWARQARSGCCAFCAMLASRGAVYKTRDRAATKGFVGASESAEDRKYHAHCDCQAVPIYSTGQALPPNSGEFKDLWAQSTRGYRAGDKLNAFRRAFEGRALPGE